MSDLTGKFAALEEQLEAADAAMQVDLNAMRSELEFLNAQIDTLNLNGAANARAILAALAANSPCTTCPPTDLTVPPVDGTLNPINEDKCKRSQAFVHALLEFATATDVLSAFSIPFNTQLVLDAVDQVITSLANGDPTPGMSWAEASNFVNEAIFYGLGNFLVGDTLVGFISELAFEIRDATYSAGSPGEAKTAYEAVIDASSVPSYAKGLLKALAWNELYTFYFDPDSDVNLTGYAGDACTEVLPTECFERVSFLYDDGFGDRSTVFLPVSYAGWSVSWPDAPIGQWVAIFSDEHPGVHIDATPTVIDITYRNHATNRFWFSAGAETPYTLEFCPPV